MAIIEHTGYYENPINGVSHMHTSCELIYLVSGRLEVVNGDKPFCLSDGDCLLIKSRKHHTIRMKSGIDYKRFVAFINPRELEKQLVRPDLFAMLTDISRSGYIVLKNTQQLYGGFEKMKDIFENGGNIYTELSAALNVISAFYEEVKPQTKTAANSAKRLSDTVRSYIESNYADNIKISSLAKENFISEGYLAHAFKSETGMSPREYLSHIRCTRAYELICHTNMKFADISCNTGFCCANDMSKKIREHYGRTPTQIRFENNR